MSEERLTSPSKMNILVGGAGFVGSHLANYLLTLDQAVLVVDKIGCSYSEPGRAKVELPPLELRSATKGHFLELVREYMPRNIPGVGPNVFLSACYLAALDQKVPRNLETADSSVDGSDEDDLVDALEAGIVGAIVFGHALRDLVAESFLKRILFFGSIYGSVAPDQRMYGVTVDTNWKPAHYSASRSAIQGITRHFAALYGVFGCSSNCIVPGGIENGQDPVFVERYSEKSMFGRMVQLEEVSSAAAFLLGPQSAGITGQALHVDGGFTSW